MGDIDPQKELNTALEYLLVLSKQDPKKLQKSLYDSFSSLSYLALEGKQAGFKPGWASEILAKDGKPLFNKEEATVIETVSLNAVKPLFDDKIQEGGDIDTTPSIRPFSTHGMIDASGSIDPDDLSLDKTYWKVREFLAGLDKQTHDLSRELGPFRFFYDMDVDFRIPIPVPLPVPPFISVVLVPISPRAVPVIISALVEGIRLLFTFGPLSNDITRKILSIVLAIVDILQGEWKHSILTFIGFFGSSPLLIGIIGKLLLNTLSLISPDLQDRLIMDIYQSTKSMSAGFVLWAFATFAPDFARITVREQFDKIKEMVNNANGEVAKIQESMQKSVSPAGLDIKFNKIPDGFVPTFDDIQNLQSIARQPSIYCSKEFQEAIAPLRVIPPARLILELLSIPTDERTLEMECKDMVGKSLDETFEKVIMPEITIPQIPIPQIPQIQPPQIPVPQIPKLPTVEALIKKGGRRSRRRYTRRASRSFV